MIHPTAIVEPGAKLGVDVEIGPYSVVGAHVRLADGCIVGPRVTLSGHTRIGRGTRIHSGAVIGDAPQDYSYDGAESYTEIGETCVLREYVTVHRGSEAGSRTVIGDGTMLMAFVHIGHNCHVGRQVAMANATIVGGHVEIADNAFLSANLLVHQFCRIGRRAMVGGRAIVTQDVPPFCLLPRTGITGPNLVGLRRSGMGADVRNALRLAIKIYFFQGLNRLGALEKIVATVPSFPEVEEFCQFVETTKRGIAPRAETEGE